ncbi:RNA 2',3'-cyclic phosphodiesterase [Propioniciclava tarda]|nr:RNA 2',3'-cyclic phosphodiesterase [Propioniciclava tarda]
MPARMFAALVPPPTVLVQLEEFIEVRREADSRVRFVPIDSWHVTTAFAAAVASRNVDDLTEALVDVAGRTPPLDLTVGGGRCLPTPVEARVLAFGVGPSEQLGRLAASCRTAFSHAGVAVDGARFVPHMTVARMRRPIEATPWLTVLDACPDASWRADELVLIESHLRDTANRYEVVERFRFKG